MGKHMPALGLPMFRSLKALVYYNLRQTKVPVGQIMNVELTNRCNQSCIFCPANSSCVTRPVRRAKKDMSMTDFEKIISRYKKYMKTICISHHGESLLHPDFDKAVTLLKKHAIPYSITTNGALIGKHIDSLKKYPPESIMFSLYTINPEKFKSLTGTGNVDVAIKNIQMLLELKKRKQIHTKIVVRVINMRGFEEDVDQVKDFFKDGDVSFDVNVLNSWAGRVDIEKFGNLAKNTVNFKYCFQPWAHTIIGSDLGVYICNNHEDKPIGYLKNRTLEEIWNSDAYKEIRRNILNGDFRKNKICSKCDYFLIGCAMNKPTPFFILDPFFLKTYLHGMGLYRVDDQSKLLKEYKKRYGRHID